MRLMFVARAINNVAGGVERMITTVMNELTRRGHTIALMTWDSDSAQSFYDIDESVNWYRINVGNAARKATFTEKLARAHRVRRYVSAHGPDCIVCFQDGPFRAVRAYCLGLGIPIVCAERNAPTRFNYTSGSRYRAFVAMLAARRLLVQCESYRVLYPGFLRNRIEVIPNPVYPARRYATPGLGDAEGRFRLLSVGRLSYQKNYAVLIEAFSLVARRFPDWDLMIVGEGEERERLSQLISERGLTARVEMPGVRRDIQRLYTESNLFCLCSRWEGFPNALAEAMSHGLPVVGFSDCAGVRELITDGTNGKLASGGDDPNSLAEALASLMCDKGLRERMGSAAVETMAEYEPGVVFDQWESVLRGVTGTGREVRAE